MCAELESNKISFTPDQLLTFMKSFEKTIVETKDVSQQFSTDQQPIVSPQEEENEKVTPQTDVQVFN